MTCSGTSRIQILTMRFASIILGIHIHDAELAKLHCHEPIIRQGARKLPHVSTSEMFAAPDATSWKEILTTVNSTEEIFSSPVEKINFPLRRMPENEFLFYGILECIGVMVQENLESPDDWPTTAQRCQDLLMAWYSGYVNFNLANGKSGSFSLMILWHSIFMNMNTRFDELERACARTNVNESEKSRKYASSWARSINAKRCLLHAILLQQSFQSSPVGLEPALHVPMALYYCGISWTSFTRFGCPVVNSGAEHEDSLDFPELGLLEINQANTLKIAARGVTWGKSDSVPLYTVTNLLGKINHWKVAQTFANTLLAMQDHP